MKVLVPTIILALCPLTLFSQGANASSKEFRNRAEQAARQELADAIKKQDWAKVKEAADELQQLQGVDKAAAKPAETNLFDMLKRSGFSLSRSPDEEKKGALFAFTQDRRANTDAVFNADFYLKWQPKPVLFQQIYDKYAVFDTLAISVQGVLTSADDKATDAWRFRLENTFFTRTADNNAWFDGLVATLSAKDESDRDFRSDRIGAELWLTFNSRKAYIGQYSGDENSLFQFRWRPYVGIDVGGTVSDEPLPGTPTSNTWLMARGRADLRFTFLLKALHFSDFTAYIDNKYVYLCEADKSRNYLDTGLDLEFNDNVGFTLQYTIGEDSPKFVREQMFKGGLTVKF